MSPRRSDQAPVSATRLRWPRPSTRAFADEARRTQGFSLFDWIHGYVYARWPYLYIGIGVGEHWLARLPGPLANAALWLISRLDRASASAPERPTFADTYHGKVVSLPAAKQLVSVREDVTLHDLEHVIPYALARDIVLHDPDHIVVLECPCRAVRAEPCLPLDVCLIVGEPMASFVAEHHPNRSRWITQGTAIEILEAEHERGHVHHAFFKDAMLGRFYAICNCCSCCCGAMQATRNGIPMLASSGYLCHVSSLHCTSCGTCVRACPFGAVSLDEDGAVVDAGACMGCGVCVSRCENGALSLALEPSKGQPLELHELIGFQEEARAG